MDQKLNTALQSVLKIVGSILAVVVLMWTPGTGKGLLVYVALFAIFVVMALMIGLSRKNRGHDSS